MQSPYEMSGSIKDVAESRAGQLPAPALPSTWGNDTPYPVNTQATQPN
jgi:hypothetical protein